MKTDIENRKDIDRLVAIFYEKAFADDVIGYIFHNAPGFVLEKHLPVIADFWQSVLFATAGYKGNPMLKHIELNKHLPLQPEHFERWLQLWEETVKENFEGKIADDAISKSKSIAFLMNNKIALFNSLQKGTTLL